MAPPSNLSRACRIATQIADDDESARVKTFCHACCEGVGCGCPCHRGELLLAAHLQDPLPILVDQPL